MTQYRIFSDDNQKSEKAGEFGYVNIIHYLAPADIAGVGDVCPHRSPACSAACLGWFSGHAAMVKDVERCDAHDLRMLDPIGCVVGLSPKGHKAKDDRSGFVVR